MAVVIPSTIVPTIREKSEEMQQDHAIRTDNKHSVLIRINPTETDVPENQISIPMTALDAIKLLF